MPLMVSVPELGRSRSAMARRNSYRSALAGFGLFELDQRPVEAFGMEEQHRQSMRPDARPAVADNACPAIDETARGLGQVWNFEAEVMDATGRVISEEF